jgi:hypothetical protein
MTYSRGQLLTHGLIAGVIGYGVVVLALAVANLMAGAWIFATPAALGSALLFGGSAPDPTVPPVAAIIAFNGVHLLASLLVGFAVSWLAYEAEQHHGLWYIVMMVLIAGFIYTLVLVGVVGAEVAEVVSWGQAVTATVLWAFAMGGYLWFAHRGLGKELAAEADAPANS